MWYGDEVCGFCRDVLRHDKFYIKKRVVFFLGGNFFTPCIYGVGGGDLQYKESWFWGGMWMQLAIILGALFWQEKRGKNDFCEVLEWRFVVGGGKKDFVKTF